MVIKLNDHQHRLDETTHLKKSGRNDPPIKAETTKKLAEKTQTEMTQTEMTQGRNVPDTVSRFWILFHMGKKTPIVHRVFKKTITNRFAGLSRRIIIIFPLLRVSHFTFPMMPVMLPSLAARFCNFSNSSVSGETSVDTCR